MRPICIPWALRRIVCTHVTQHMQKRFAEKLLPFNFAIGVPGGMDFVIKFMQLSIEKYIIEPQSRPVPALPSRVAIFLDLINMFNNISQAELMNLLEIEFPELLPLALLLYGRPNKVHFKWHDGSWRQITMIEGVNQGCPFSAVLVALVLDRLIRPLDAALRQ